MLTSERHNLVRPLLPEWRFVTIFVSAVMCLYCDPPAAPAQSTTIIAPTTGSGDLGTTVTSHGHTVQITGGTRPDKGTNLFHSFDRFSVGHSDTAQFLNATPVLHTSNILARVTGGNPSSIFGTIDTLSYPGANLFLMNPAGIVFGPHATLNVAGSVTFTSANYLRLADNGRFTAVPNATTDALLSAAPVVAYGFLGSNSETIAVQGSRFTVPRGNSLSLVGGNITVQSGTVKNSIVQPAHLAAPGGQINLVSMGLPGEITVETSDSVSHVTGRSFEALGAIQISQRSTIDTSGEGGGTIRIRGGSLIIDNSTISANMVAMNTHSHTGRFGKGIDIQVAQDATIQNKSILETNAIGPVASNHRSGGVHIAAQDITVSGGPDILEIAKKSSDGSFPFSGIRSNIAPKSTAGRSGDITLEATSIHMQDLGQIETRTAGKGNAGYIFLQTLGNIDLNNAIVASESNTSSGHAGNILFSSNEGDIHLTTSFLTSQTVESSGNAGTITLTAPLGNIVLTDMSQVLNATRGTGVLGGIQIAADNLQLQGESRIEGDNFSTPAAENISLALNHRLTLTDHSVIETGASGATEAAPLMIKASDMLIAHGSRLFTGTTGSGAGGAIDLSTRSLTIQDDGKVSAETSGIASSAKGGSIIVKAKDQVTLSKGASITASSIGPADAGTITINAGQKLELLDRSSITTTTQLAQANGGNITIQAIDHVRLVNHSEISTSVKGAEGSGGNIFIDPKVVVLQGSNVTAQAVGGSGGNITFVTPLFVADSVSLVSASSQRGVNGTVTIQSPTSNLSGTVGQLVSKAMPLPVLLQNRCVALAGSERSTFLLAGRDNLPAEPGGWLSSPVSMEHWMGEETEQAAGPMVRSQESNAMPVSVTLMDKTKVLSLRRLTQPGFLVRTFATPLTGCPS